MDDEPFLCNDGDVLTDAPLDDRVDRFLASDSVASLRCVRPASYSFHLVRRNGSNLVTQIDDVGTSDLSRAHMEDAHQDHRLVAETVWQTFRHHLVAAYEIPKYDGDLGRPNLFVDVDQARLQRKIDLLQAYYPSHYDRTWWGADAIRAIVRLRGIEAATRYAEAFYCRKLVL